MTDYVREGRSRGAAVTRRVEHKAYHKQNSAEHRTDVATDATQRPQTPQSDVGGSGMQMLLGAPPLDNDRPQICINHTIRGMALLYR